MRIVAIAAMVALLGACGRPRVTAGQAPSPPLGNTYWNLLVHDDLVVDHQIVHGLLGRLDDLVDAARALADYVRRAGPPST